MTSTRTNFFKQLNAVVALSSLALSCLQPSAALSMNENRLSKRITATDKYKESYQSGASQVAYRSLALRTNGVDVPVAMWYPIERDSSTTTTLSSKPIMDYPQSRLGLQEQVKFYKHRISVKRIGELLAGWDFIPDFVSQDFQLEPTLQTATLMNGDGVDPPKRGPVILLAHGYLGSRFDLSHLAEELAQQGFTCVSPEYPESLAASYPKREGLDRSVITSRLLDVLKNDFQMEASSYGIVGHSLGCGTAISTGDEQWTRVLIAGFPRSTCSGSVLMLSSVNDGAVSFARMGGRENVIPKDFVEISESIVQEPTTRIPSRAALVFDRQDAPNHISFLSNGVNDAMIDLLSPLLPVARVLSIPVLDFDKYQKSRDSAQTARIVIPLVTTYLKQRMI